MTPNGQVLFDKGFKKQVFFYQIGGGEDEDDTDIFVKDDTVVFYDYSYKVWRKCSYSEINYIKGLPCDAEIVENLNDL